MILSRSTFERPIKVWDASLRREVLVRPFLYLVLADNVMASALCSHVGTGNNTFPCRICLYGRTKKDRRTAAGLQKLLKVSIYVVLADSSQVAEWKTLCIQRFRQEKRGPRKRRSELSRRFGI